MKIRLAALFLLTLAALAQNSETSSYPNDTDLTLGVQKDSSLSTLNGSVTSSATALTVVNGGNFLIGEWITIGNTDLRQITAISTNVLTINTGVSQGYASGTRVEGRMNAKYHNALAAAIKAIEAGGAGVTAGTSLPGTCSPGAQGLYFLTNGTTYPIGLYICISSNNWRNIPYAGDPTVNSYIDLFPANDSTHSVGLTTGARTTKTRYSLPSADPVGNQMLVCGTPSSNVSSCIWQDIPSGTGTTYPSWAALTNTTWGTLDSTGWGTLTQ